MCSNFPGEGPGEEERIETEGLGQPPNLAGVEDDRSSSGIDAEVTGIHVGLGEDQRLMSNADVGDGWGELAELRNSLARRKKEKLCVSRGMRTQSVTLQSIEADKVQRRLAVLENHVAGTAVALSSWPEDDVVRSRHTAHPANRLRSLRGKDLDRDLNQVNVLHDYVGHPSIVVEEVVNLRHAWRARIALGEVGQVLQRHDLGVEGQVPVELDKVLAEWEAASVVAIILILALVLGAGAHDSWLEGGKVRGRGRRHQWEVLGHGPPVRMPNLDVPYIGGGRSGFGVWVNRITAAWPNPPAATLGFLV
jgi:hypothetical protein